MGWRVRVGFGVMVGGVVEVGGVGAGERASGASARAEVVGLARVAGEGVADWAFAIVAWACVRVGREAPVTGCVVVAHTAFTCRQSWVDVCLTDDACAEWRIQGSGGERWGTYRAFTVVAWVRVGVG